MLLPWMAAYEFASNTLASSVSANVTETARISVCLDCYNNPSSLFSMAEFGLELTLGAIVVITICHLARMALQQRIAEQRSTDGLEHAPARFRARPSRRHS